MSNLQIGLAVAGGLILAGFVAHGAWTTRRNAPRQASFGETQPASRLDATEPTLDDDSALASRPAQVAHMVRKAALDALLDVVATVNLEHSAQMVSGDAAIAAMPGTRRVGSKPFAIEGCNAETGQWEVPTPGERYSAFQAGVQLANRSGALNEIEYSEFVVKTQAFADAVNATADFPEMREQIARARELDHFASPHDAQLSFTVRARSASWSPGYVQQHAARQGFQAGAIPGRLVLPANAPGLPPVLVLSFDSQAALAEDPAQSALRDVCLHLDVGQVSQAENAFERMRQAAFALAEVMDGVVTDDHGQALSNPAMDQIGSELQTLYCALEQRDLAAGSPLARRLFS